MDQSGLDVRLAVCETEVGIGSSVWRRGVSELPKDPNRFRPELGGYDSACSCR